MTTNSLPLETFVPAPNSGLVAHFARRGGRVEQRPVVGWFQEYFEHESGDVETTVYAGVMGRNGCVTSPVGAELGGGGEFIGVYPVGDDPRHVDYEQYRAVSEHAR